MDSDSRHWSRKPYYFISETSIDQTPTMCLTMYCPIIACCLSLFTVLTVFHIGTKTNTHPHSVFQAKQWIIKYLAIF